MWIWLYYSYPKHIYVQKTIRWIKYEHKHMKLAGAVKKNRSWNQQNASENIHRQILIAEQKFCTVQPQTAMAAVASVASVALAAITPTREHSSGWRKNASLYAEPKIAIRLNFKHSKLFVLVLCLVQRQHQQQQRQCAESPNCSWRLNLTKHKTCYVALKEL